MAEQLSEEQAVVRLRPGAWSAAEVLDHLVQTELAFRKYLILALGRARAGDAQPIRIGFDQVDTRLRPLPKTWMPVLTPLLFALHAVTPFSVRLSVMRRRGLVWAAAPRVAMPLGKRMPAELRAHLAAEMERTRELFEGDLPAMLPRIRAAHPLYGWNDMAQVIRLMAAHEQRHQHQLRTIVKKL